MRDRPALSKDRTIAFLKTAHAGRTNDAGPQPLEHCLLVADMAAILSAGYLDELRGYRSDVDAAMLESSWHAGAMHDVINNGNKAYDDLVAVAGIDVADLVGRLSLDRRLPSPLQIRKHISMLHEADVPIKILKLSDLSCELEGVVDFCCSAPDTARKQLQFWLLDFQTYLMAIQTLQKLPSLRDAWQKTAAAFDELQLRLKPPPKKPRPRPAVAVPATGKLLDHVLPDTIISAG